MATHTARKANGIYKCNCGLEFKTEAEAVKHADNASYDDAVGIDKQPAKPADKKAEPTPPPAPPATVPTPTVVSGKPTVGNYLRNDLVKKRIDEMLGKRSNQFITALMAATNNVAHLSECSPASVLNAALTVAALDLPINNNLGFAYIIPYQNSKKVGNNWVKEYEAQFQMGWKGFIQLAQRSGQYKTIGASPVYEGQLISSDPLRGNHYDWTAKKSEKIIGYVSLFVLSNGFEKDLYMTMDEVKEHANRFSQAYRSDQKYDKKSSPWSSDFDSMAQKTVIKQLISKFGPMSIDPQMQMAVEKDQAIIEDEGTIYPDNTDEINDRINAAASREAVEEIMSGLTVDERKKAAATVGEKLKEFAK